MKAILLFCLTYGIALAQVPTPKPRQRVVVHGQHLKLVKQRGKFVITGQNITYTVEPVK
jgi:hypothetical protein